MNDSGKFCARDAPRPADGHPIFGESDVLTRLQERIGLLISKQSRLHFCIGAIVVRAGFSPVQTVRVNSPGPDLFCRQFVVAREMSHSSVHMRMPNAHEIFATSMDKQR